MDSIEKLVKDKSEKLKAPDSHENKHEQMVDMLMASMDLENVETSLDDLDFGKVVETDEEIVFYCKVCFENNPPPPSDKNTTGCFTLDLMGLFTERLLSQNTSQEN